MSTTPTGPGTAGLRERIERVHQDKREIAIALDEATQGEVREGILERRG